VARHVDSFGRHHARGIILKFIELAGTPKSGKDSIQKNLASHFQDADISIIELKGGISRSPVKKKDSIAALVWSMCDLQINYINCQLQKKASYTIINRGFFDRLIWIEQYIKLGIIDESVAKKYADCWLEFAFDKMNTIVFLLITPPDKAIQRDPRIINGTSKQSIMNYSFLSSFNESCMLAYARYKNNFKHVQLVDERTVSFPLIDKVDMVLASL